MGKLECEGEAEGRWIGGLVDQNVGIDGAWARRRSSGLVVVVVVVVDVEVDDDAPDEPRAVVGLVGLVGLAGFGAGAGADSRPSPDGASALDLLWSLLRQ
ncbi:predicted protein [Histoplasma capsulatum G186AR]|uniref:Uncharacterized protein n=1 Tax=Ajellomyces capsulatus (strain G186AR / H82 / ATCC MYA-2454 / RMSCC 2432) TaxID=447093 RepID=C0NRC4_AJECG|nr:uncharacterized protein HCBG_05554 [Histoplasma capsulatum G186AR]EEH06238.1 predicted protein [Histoplasma capsulatum G186AR]